MTPPLEQMLVRALHDAHLFEREERPLVARRITQSVTERLLDQLTEAEETREVGEAFQRSLLSGEDMLVAAAEAHLTSDDAFAEAFSSVLAEVLDEVIELMESDDAQTIRQRLHAAVIDQMRLAVDAP